MRSTTARRTLIAGLSAPSLSVRPTPRSALCRHCLLHYTLYTYICMYILECVCVCVAAPLPSVSLFFLRVSPWLLHISVCLCGVPCMREREGVCVCVCVCVYVRTCIHTRADTHKRTGQKADANERVVAYAPAALHLLQRMPLFRLNAPEWPEEEEEEAAE